MADYNINAVTRRVVFTGSAGLGPYAFTFEVLNSDDVAVYFNATLLTITTDYTVAINANGTGSVTIVTGGSVPSTPTASDSIIIVGARDIERVTDFVTAGDLLASSLNEQLDALTIFDQQVAEEQKRSLQAPVYDPAHVDDGGTLDMTLPAKAARAGKYLQFNSTTGNPEAGPDSTDVTTLADIATDIATLADIEDGTDATDAIQTVAGISSNVSTVAGISSNVTTVAGISSDVTSVAGDATDIGTVATNIANVNTVAGNNANITTVAGISANVTTVAGDSADIQAVAADAADIGTVASNIADVNTAAANITDIQNASTNAATATTKAAEASTSASNAATSETNAATSASAAAASQTAAATSAAAAASAFDNFDDTYLGSKTSDPTVDNDGDPLTTGDLYFNSTANEMRVYDGANWIAASSAGGASLILYEYTATSGQTTFSGADDNAATLSYTADNIQVVMNGIVLDPSDYTASNGTSVVLASGAAANDLVNIYAFKSFTVADTVSASAGGTFSANVSFADNAKAIFGAGSDLQIYHDGNNSLINDLGTGDLRLRSNGSGVIVEMSNGNDLAQFLNGSGEAKLMHNGSEKLATTSSGIDVTGAITTDAITETSGGNVGIGTTSPVSQMTLGGTSDLVFTQNGYGIAWGSNNGSPRIFGTSGGSLSFKHGGGSTAMTIDSSGDVMVGSTSYAVTPTSGVTIGTGANATVNVGHNNSPSGFLFVNFGYNGGQIGSITQNGTTGVSFNTSSDHRLKENVADMTGAIDRVKALAPKRFNFIADADRTVDGFLAHEAQAVVPEAVTGTHNEVDDDGNAVMQGIDQSKLVPLLTGALREAIAKIETLETQRADLEARLTALENAS